MMLNTAQRERLTAIEDACILLEARDELILQMNRRVAKLKSAKLLEATKADLTASQLDKLRLEEFVKQETEALFEDAFGVSLDAVVRVETAEGQGQEPMVVNLLRARQLSNGVGVFFVAGDSLERNVSELPMPVMFRIAEESGDRFVVES